MSEEKNNHIWFYTLLVSLMTCMIATYMFRVDIPRIVLDFLLISIAALGNNNEIITVILSCMILNYSISFYLVITVCIIIYCLKNFKKLKLGLPIVLIAIMFVWEFLHCIDEGSNIVASIGGMMPLVVLVVIISSDVRDINYTFIVRVLSCVLICVCLIQMCSLVTFFGGDFVNAFTNLQRLGSFKENETIVGMLINPNTLGILSVLILTGLLQLCHIGKECKYDLFLCTAVLIFGMLTSSRTFLVCLILVWIAFIIGKSGGMVRKIKSSFSLMMYVVTIIFVVSIIFPETLDFYFKRFSETDITSGRGVLISIYNNFITNNSNVMFFGIGLNGFAEKLINVHNIYDGVPHNGIQEVIIAWGIPGIIMICFLLVLMIMESKRYMCEKTIINFIPLIIILFKSMAGQLITSGYTMLALSFAYISLCQYFNIRK